MEDQLQMILTFLEICTRMWRVGRAEHLRPPPFSSQLWLHAVPPGVLCTLVWSFQHTQPLITSPNLYCLATQSVLEEGWWVHII